MLKITNNATFNEQRRLIHAVWLFVLVFALTLRAEDGGASEASPPPSIAEKWNLFDTETATSFTLGAGAFNAAVSQITHSAPLYGRQPWPSAYPERFGASIGDIASQNFFGDFLLASAFHEDTRYQRRGPRPIGFGHASATRSAARSSPEPIPAKRHLIGRMFLARE